MPQQIFVNLPVEDLARSVEFFAKLGYTFDPRFTDENATCMIIGAAPRCWSDSRSIRAPRWTAW